VCEGFQARCSAADCTRQRPAVGRIQQGMQDLCLVLVTSAVANEVYLSKIGNFAEPFCQAEATILEATLH